MVIGSSTPWQLTVIQLGVHMLITRDILIMIGVVMHGQGRVTWRTTRFLLIGESYVCFHCSCRDIHFNKCMIQFLCFLCIMHYVKYCLRNCLVAGGPSSRLEKKPTINSWTRHALCDSVLSYERNRWKFEHVIRNSIGNEIWSIYNDKYFKIWTFFS